MSSELMTPRLFYKPLPLSDSLNLTDAKHGSHCMLYSTPDSNGISYALLQMRFDGTIGFAGGEVDVDEDDNSITIERIIEATNRELEEEINYDFERVTESDWICTYRDNSSRFVQHFFARELTFDQILYLEKTHMKAQHFPYESLGVFHIPIGGSDQNNFEFSAKFLINFLRQKFAGNARQQMIETIIKRDLLNKDQLKTIERNFSEEENSDNNGDTEVKAMLKTELPVHYHGEDVDAVYGLMIIRDNGLFDFIGTDYVDARDKDLMIRTINDSLRRDLGSYIEFFVSDKEELELSFDNDLSHVFHIQINSNQFQEIEDNFTQTENFNRTSFGLIRIPFRFSGETKETDNYVKRFLNGFLCQKFVNNSRNQLKSIFENFDKL